ncbi:MAG: site-specific integrase [Acidobacteriota bacterium]|nr:site-specific integrase [Acidobacteriota bacterium]
MRKSLDLRNWEAATKLIRNWEIEGTAKVVTVRMAGERFLADREALKLSEAMIGKYKRVKDELVSTFGDRPVKSVTTDDIRAMRETWKLAPITSQKRMEMVRKFFTFCVDSDWIVKNPAKGVETAAVIHDPTLPFTELEMEKILWAADSIREAHPRIPEKTPKKLKALILLMRYSGVRISDAVMFKRNYIRDDNLFLRQEKTKQNVWVPLPPFVVKAVMDCDEGNDYFFYKQVGTTKSCVKEWCERLRKVYDMAGLPDGHSHRLRDTFSVELLQKGVSIETVSRLLGHQNIAVTQKHYNPWIKSRQDALEKAVRLTWA